MSGAEGKRRFAPGPMPKGHPLGRREFLTSSLAGLLAAGLWPGGLEAQDSGENFQFVAMNDTHFRDDQDLQFFEQLAARIRGTEGAAEFILHAGDVVDGGLPKQLGPMKSFFDSLDRPCHLVPGNHDVDVDDGSLRSYRAVFGEHAANAWFKHKGWQFVGLDSTEGTKWKDVQVQAANLAWLHETVAELDHQKPVVLYTHMPLGSEVPYQAANADAVLSMFVEHNLKAVFNAHFHGYTLRDYRGAGVTTDRCLSRWRANMDGSVDKGYFRCKVEAGHITREFVRFNFKA